ncbi:hypothetical protein F441_12791 [Phytophthora nicotianae CJ01A1]|uniref:Myb-like domain-containing protein n=5 Tax=Phytophthora nicotianae TaxID=4792 RepID=W2Q058_PHYN3|nr:hypothetical protein PPTG_14366 [Phytophthora nicotianae INRA-310]ETK82031.1 hypothetical protein L915_12544 [Phytophthora nicotianae]ETP11733.1 hypothetical protein F441_12791 [Phytophthora nicotianae CJ01A1]ETP39872.1 hypothetical protein F442_12742 [Phytophthora nicotianae P10297]ETL35412.1 hypothetical protein L916_12455 [Phytophthora nicotianae]ETN05680.1 hypothetical protein PPTG_14366 [Phytophthora nicotianae INRA-310]
MELVIFTGAGTSKSFAYLPGLQHGLRDFEESGKRGTPAPESDTRDGFVREEDSQDQYGPPSFGSSYLDEDSTSEGSREGSDSNERAPRLNDSRSEARDDAEPPKQRSFSNAVPPEDIPSKSKRKKFTNADDVALLRQVQADMPFKAAKGGVMASWDSLANNLKTLKNFSKKDTISGKSAQARFNTLVISYRKFDRKSEGASDIDQRYAEKRQLLDDLVSQFDEHERDEARRTRELKDKLAAEENAGKVMRDAGLKRMKERKKKARIKLMRTRVPSVTSPASST